MKKILWLLIGCSMASFPSAFAVCPPADLTRDCYVDLEDLAIFARNWLAGDRLPEGMISIPAGTFQMGDSTNLYEGFNEYPVHLVTLDPFAMGKFEITNGQYCAFLNSAYPSQLKVVDDVIYSTSDASNSFPLLRTRTYYYFYSPIIFANDTFSIQDKGRDMSNDPMRYLTWYGAVAYCNWRSQQEGFQSCYDLTTWECDFTKSGYRLPTEAEWEYAARGGLFDKRFPWGDTITHTEANYQSDGSVSYDLSQTPGYHPLWNTDSYPYTSPVGSFPANAYGLFDMAGNVFEWCHDWYYVDYNSEPQRNPTGPETGDYRVIRGGNWANNAYWCRVSSRYIDYPNHGGEGVGFRVVLNIE